MMNLLLIVCSVTQMALDQICVVTPSNPRQCQNQDVLFLGTGMPYTSYPKTNNKRSDQEMCIPSRIFSFCMSVATNNKLLWNTGHVHLLYLMIITCMSTDCL